MKTSWNKAIEFRHQTGSYIEVDETKTTIQEHLKEKAEKEGFVYISNGIGNTTARNYLVLLASQET